MVRNARRTEAEIQADVRQFILSAPFELEDSDLADVILESPLGDRRRIDVEAGSTVIEVKRDLRKEKAKREAEDQLAGYVDYRMRQTEFRYVGVLTDGTEWNCYDLVDGKLRRVSQLILEDTALDVSRLVVWLEGGCSATSTRAVRITPIRFGRIIWLRPERKRASRIWGGTTSDTRTGRVWEAPARRRRCSRSSCGTVRLK
ncbi:MAG: hypothetical protein QOJ99_3460 [Bryobacterales bacterium]|nr:hypothetical protein [Bryobacterales bacterium]